MADVQDPGYSYECSASLVPYLEPCPAGLVWNDKAKFCDFPARHARPRASARQPSTTA